MKISEKQKEVIRLINDGWVLHKARFGEAYFSLSKENEIVKFVHKGTGRALVNNGIVLYKQRDSVQTSSYELSAFGKNLQL